MNRRYGLLFLLLGCSCALLAALAGSWQLVLWGWFGVAFCFVGIAYLAGAPRLLGKRPDGSIGYLHTTVLLPFLLLALAISYLERLLSREAPCHEVAPGLWVGRRPVRGERLPAKVTTIIDLTAELPRRRGDGEEIAYLCVPTLDGTAPQEAELRGVVSRILSTSGSVYVHCASGHGRSATVAAAVLIARGAAADGEAAEGQLRSVRPGVRLSGAQRLVLASFGLTDEGHLLDRGLEGKNP